MKIFEGEKRDGLKGSYITPNMIANTSVFFLKP